MECPKCGRVASDGVKFCAGCGARLDPARADGAQAGSGDACPDCGAVHPPGARFCKQCGHAFVAVAAPPPLAAAETPVPAQPSPAASVAREEPRPAPVDVVTPPPAAPRPVEQAQAARPAPPPDPVPPKLVPPPEPPLARSVPETAPAARPGVAASRSSRLPVLLGAIALVVVAAALATYFLFLRPASKSAAVTATPAASVPATAATSPAAMAPIVSAMAAAGMPTGSVQAVAPEASALAPSTNVPQQEASPVAAAQPGPTAVAEQAPDAVAPAPAPVDHTLQIAANLVRKGNRAYADGDYETAVRHAKSALDVRPGYADAERLLRRSYAAQQGVSEHQARAQQQQVADVQEPVQAAAAPAAPAGPTPDQVYNQRAHSECARGMFGKSCRHKIRVEVCAGIAPGTPGATECKQ